MSTIYNTTNVNRILKVSICCFAFAIASYFYINMRVVSGIISHKRHDIKIAKITSEILEREKDLAVIRASLNSEGLLSYNLVKTNESKYLIKSNFNILTMNYEAE